MPYDVGQVLLRRYVRDGRYVWVQPMRVVRDDDAGLLLWHPAGSEYARVVDADGKVEPDLTWRWKDEDEFDAVTGNLLYFDAAKAAEVRATGRAVVEVVERGGYPFDGTYVDFTPDPAWPVLPMPAGWERPDARP